LSVFLTTQPTVKTEAATPALPYVFEVRICEARRLRRDDGESLFGSDAPSFFAAARCLVQESRTDAAFPSCNPRWNHLAKLACDDPENNFLEVCVWRRSASADVCVGGLRIPLSGLERGVVRDCWYPLALVVGGAAVSAREATIRVRVMAVNFGDLTGCDDSVPPHPTTVVASTAPACTLSALIHFTSRFPIVTGTPAGRAAEHCPVEASGSLNDTSSPRHSTPASAAPPTPCGIGSTGNDGIPSTPRAGPACAATESTC